MAGRSALPTDAELANLADLPAVVQWVGLTEAFWNSCNAAFDTFPNLRLLSQAPADMIAEGISSMRIRRLDAAGNPLDPPEVRELTMVEMIQLALVWRVARVAYGLEDIDIMAPRVVASLGTPSSGSVATGANAVPIPPNSVYKHLGVQKVKVSQVADQLDDIELEVISKTDIDETYNQYLSVMGADPVKEAEPSVEQITVMHNRIVTRGAAPYGDFSVLTPYSRRHQKTMIAKGFLLQEDGTWKQSEVAGPPSFDAWTACWDVSRTISPDAATHAGSRWR